MNKYTCEHAIKVEPEEVKGALYFCELSEIIDDNGTKRYFQCNPEKCPLKEGEYDNSL